MKNYKIVKSGDKITVTFTLSNGKTLVYYGDRAKEMIKKYVL